MNKSTMATIIGTAALGLMKASGSKSKRNINPIKISDLYKLSPEAVEISGYALQFSSLTELPDDIFEGFENLETLYFRWHKSNTLPSSIGNLTNLKDLFLNKGRLTALPQEIGNLTNLKNLHLNDNNLSSLPHSIINLKKLRHLHLENNNFSALPEYIGELSELMMLILLATP